MIDNYILDGINPRGAEYGAAARAARASEQTQQTLSDMLALELAPNAAARQRVIDEINARERHQAVVAGRGRAFKHAAFALLVAFCVCVWQLGDDNSALSGAYKAFMATPTSQAPDDANAPVSAATAPDDSDPAVVVSRGEQVLRDSGMSNEQIFGNSQ